MRTLLIAALALSSTLPSPAADACGGYGVDPAPQVLQLTHHGAVISDRGTVSAPRSFVHTPEVAPDGLTWSWLTPRTFDTTQIATAPTAATPVTFTLLGPSGTRVVTATRKVFLADARPERGAHGAFEVPITRTERFEIAIEGSQRAARWLALEAGPVTAARLRWLAALGVTPHDQQDVVVTRVAGTDLETISVFPKGGTRTLTFVKQGARNHGSFEGSAIGAFANRGARQLVLRHEGRISVVALGAEA
ncbi:MAG: hypothetical protein M3680_36325 [Myxococcota bacterium]|nr:hypothetical protein [Myxococcota bacterium]